MSEFGSEVSSSEVSGDSGTTSEVSEVDTGSEVSESEMDEDLSHELDDSYDSYMEEGEGKSFESDFNENEEVDETDLEESDEPPDDLESDLDNKYDSYIEDKDLSSYEKGKATDVNTDELDSEVDDHYNEYVEHGEKSEPTENVDNKTDDVESNSDLKPMSRKACEKCHDAGLTDEQVEEIREIPNGEKPEPESYLDQEYIDDHLSKFEESGCYKIVSDRRGEPSGTIGDEGVFVLNGEEVNQMIDDANGDPRKLEESLGMPEGYLGDDPYIIRCDDPQNLRMADGNEPNAWQDEWCPAGTTRGGMDEAVIDPMDEGEYSYKHVFGDDDWKK